jgi:hypothetical protein
MKLSEANLKIAMVSERRAGTRERSEIKIVKFSFGRPISALFN